MVNNQYIPAQGDIIFLDFNPQVGHEQRGIRPGLVISSIDFNKFTKLAIVCPITNKVKGFPLHVDLLETQKTTGTVMCEHLKSIDYFHRNVKFVEKISEDTLVEVLNITESFFE